MNDFDYFREYGAAALDAEKLKSFYGDCSIAVGPTFVGCIRGADETGEAMESVVGYQRQTGLRSFVPASVETEAIDGLHRWVKVTWCARFQKTGDRDITFDVSYLLRKEDPGDKILVSVSHQDEQVMRQELGIA